MIYPIRLTCCTVNINTDTTLDQVRAAVPAFFRFGRNRQERKSMYRGCVIVKATNTYSNYHHVTDFTVYLYDNTDKDTNHLGSFPTLKAAKDAVDTMIFVGTTHHALRPRL